MRKDQQKILKSVEDSDCVEIVSGDQVQVRARLLSSLNDLQAVIAPSGADRTRWIGTRCFFTTNVHI